MRYILPLLLVCSPAFAQDVTIQQRGVTSQQFGAFLQQMQGALTKGGAGISPQQQRKLQQGIVASRGYGCVEAQVGTEPMQGFMREMETAGKQIESLCQQGKAEEARGMSLALLRARHNDPVALAGKQCYTQLKPELLPLLSPEQAADAVKYERWAYDPDLAARETTTRDVCKGSPTVMAAPAAPVVAAPAAPTAPSIQPPNQDIP